MLPPGRLVSAPWHMAVITKAAPPHLRTGRTEVDGHAGPVLGLAEHGWYRKNTGQWHMNDPGHDLAGSPSLLPSVQGEGGDVDNPQETLVRGNWAVDPVLNSTCCVNLGKLVPSLGLRFHLY